MDKITLEYIAPYLPYGLKVKIGDRIIKDVVFEPERNLTSTTVNNVVTGFGYKLVLRPMNLTQPIILNGVEIIPLVELAKIALPSRIFKIWEDHAVSDSGEDIVQKFYYVPSGNTFIHETKGFGRYKDRSGYNPIYRPLALFQWLFKHKFDVFGLLEKGLAVDVNTLEANPYE